MRDTFYANMGVLTEEAFNTIRQTSALVVGLGGLGGHLANALVRMGVRRLTLVDPDRYVQSNLNRQLFSALSHIGKPKVDVVKDALNEVFDDLEIRTHTARIEALDDAVFRDVDVVFDGVDDAGVKCDLERRAGEANVLLVHGAIGGWYGQTAVLTPPSVMLKTLYDGNQDGLEKTLRCPTFTLGVVAHWMVAQWTKYLLGHPSAKVNRLLMIDLLDDACEVMVERRDAHG